MHELDSKQYRLEQRIAELETKIAFQDDTIEQLSNEISNHQAALHLVHQQIQLLGERFKQIKDEMPQRDGIQHEIPPHY